MKKILKNKKGFTLVELIVVIAILGVLAVIMVPAFTGYINKAKDSSAHADAKAWCTAYQAAYADSQGDVTKIPAAMTALGMDSNKTSFPGAGTNRNYTVSTTGATGACTVTTPNN